MSTYVISCVCVHELYVLFCFARVSCWRYTKGILCVKTCTSHMHICEGLTLNFMQQILQSTGMYIIETSLYIYIVTRKFQVTCTLK